MSRFVTVSINGDIAALGQDDYPGSVDISAKPHMGGPAIYWRIAPCTAERLHQVFDAAMDALTENPDGPHPDTPPPAEPPPEEDDDAPARSTAKKRK